ncbi:Lysine decarboxylase [Alteracholeplasma palmae J233]|uniref:Lysine decarboxylase n=1 Tax=Alteracholeplasma palmae (strain ATCC 49389 / J233) TaxID=1318466 RepID=U4KJM2_ALTPJ|nr:aminotransferase class I/II-fold pyridoxal phosphate-dependent enzyme [Alteracholeplasma palmae]CCV63724.1 Lysine decarboxylase [Alteracholeplasma palmae J233]
MKKLNQLETPFFTKLKEYAESDTVPLDVPGHKLRNIEDDFLKYIGNNALRLDSNAPRGLDNLSKPKGVIKEAEALMADAFKATHAHFLVNGTTQGILAMIMATCRAKEKIILPRNVHKSVINALILSGAIPIFILPELDEDLGIANQISFSALEKTILEHPDAKAVFIINPTYFGVTADLEKIVNLAHENDMLVLVDEAHGAHFSFNDKLPLSAMEANADIASCSLHKTVGSLTQSSILLTKGDRIDQERLKSTLNMIQTTSPSSLLMASLDVSRKTIYQHGQKSFDHLLSMLDKTRENLNQIPNVKAFAKDYFIDRGYKDYDQTKLIIKVSEMGLTGFEVYQILSDVYHIQLELAETHLVLAVLSMGTRQEDLDRLTYALKELSDQHKGKEALEFEIIKRLPETYIRPRDAYHAPKKLVLLEEAIGEVSAESLMIYPPGIPLVIPGEIIDKQVIEDLNFYEKQGSVILSDTKAGYIKVVDKEEWEKWSEKDI